MPLGEESAELEGGRVLALSDGVFAIAATLLALDLRVPEGLSPEALRAALDALGPSLQGFAIGYLVIGLLWLGHHQQFAAMNRISPPVAVVNVLLLGMVVLLPFPTSVLTDYADDPIAVVLYALNVGAVSALEMVIVVVAHHCGDFRDRVRVPWAFARSAITTAVFLASVPLAMVSPEWAMLSWLLLIPVHYAEGRVAKRVLGP